MLQNRVNHIDLFRGGGAGGGGVGPNNCDHQNFSYNRFKDNIVKVWINFKKTTFLLFSLIFIVF